MTGPTVGARHGPAAEAAGEGRRRLRIRIGIVLKALVSFLILGVLLWKFRDGLPALSRVDARALATATALLLLQPPLVALRWWLLLRLYGARTRVPSVLAITWISVFANQFLPASVGGDAIRIFGARAQGETLGAAASSVVLDRLMALLALALLLAGFSFTLRGVASPWVLSLPAAAAVGGLVAGIGLLHLSARFVERLAAWPRLHRLARPLISMLRGLRDPRRLSVVTVLAVLVHLLSFGAFALICAGIGVHIAPLTVVAVACLLTFAQVVPISIGGWGVREAASVSVFGLIGVAQGPALLASLLLGIAYAVASLPGALVWLVRGAGRAGGRR